MIGKLLGHYKIIRQLGQGGMGSVYVAEQLGLDRQVALKILQPALASDEVIVQRFLQEARIAANLHHHHIVTIYDVDEIDGFYYIAMRYIEGEDLGHLLRREAPLDPERALAMVEQIADALDFAHAHGVLHRDIKPANIMVEPGDVLTLTDFGIARAGDQSHLTATHMVIGTPEYMSPEQALGEPVDERADLYALGILLYQALSGQLPFQASSTPALLFMHVNKPPPPLCEVRPDLPRGLSDVLARAMAKDPADRYQSGHEMVAAVRDVVSGQPTLADEPTTLTEARPTIPTPKATPAPFPVGQMPSPSTTRPSGITASPSSRSSDATAPPAGRPSGSTATATPPHGTVVPPPPWESGIPRVEPPRVNAARAPTHVMTPPPERSDHDGAARGPEQAAATGTVDRTRSLPAPTAWQIGPVIVAVVALAIALFVLIQSGTLRELVPAPTPTTVAVRPTALPPIAPTAEAPARPTPAAPSVAVSKPAESPVTAAPVPTVPPPTPAQTPTSAPPTPSPAERVALAQSAVAAGDLVSAIQQLEGLRQDPSIKADPKLAATVDETLRKAFVVSGSQFLDQGKLDDSYAQFGKALAISPNDPEATNGQKRVILTKNYGIMEANWGNDDDRAIQALEENMVLDPGFRDMRSKLYALLIAKADRLLSSGDRDAAFPVLMRALDVQSDRPEAKQRLATYTPTPTPPPTPRPAPTAPPYVPPRPAPAPYVPPSTEPSGPFVPPGSPV